MDTPPRNRLRLARPYQLTGGRTRGMAGDIPIETLVISTVDAHSTSLEPDEITLLAMAIEPTSIAELGAGLALPIGVARVMVADLAMAGMLQLCDVAESGDVELVERLLEGIRAL